MLFVHIVICNWLFFFETQILRAQTRRRAAARTDSVFAFSFMNITGTFIGNDGYIELREFSIFIHNQNIINLYNLVDLVHDVSRIKY